MLVLLDAHHDNQPSTVAQNTVPDPKRVELPVLPPWPAIPSPPNRTAQPISQTRPPSPTEMLPSAPSSTSPLAYETPSTGTLRYQHHDGYSWHEIHRDDDGAGACYYLPRTQPADSSTKKPRARTPRSAPSPSTSPVSPIHVQLQQAPSQPSSPCTRRWYDVRDGDDSVNFEDCFEWISCDVAVMAYVSGGSVASVANLDWEVQCALTPLPKSVLRPCN